MGGQVLPREVHGSFEIILAHGNDELVARHGASYDIEVGSKGPDMGFSWLSILHAVGSGFLW